MFKVDDRLCNLQFAICNLLAAVPPVPGLSLGNLENIDESQTDRQTETNREGGKVERESYFISQGRREIDRDIEGKGRETE